MFGTLQVMREKGEENKRGDNKMTSSRTQGCENCWKHRVQQDRDSD